MSPPPPRKADGQEARLGPSACRLVLWLWRLCCDPCPWLMMKPGPSGDAVMPGSAGGCCLCLPAAEHASAFNWSFPQPVAPVQLHPLPASRPASHCLAECSTLCVLQMSPTSFFVREPCLLFLATPLRPSFSESVCSRRSPPWSEWEADGTRQLSLPRGPNFCGFEWVLATGPGISVHSLVAASPGSSGRVTTGWF